jgi:kynurenine 3-monooxygenase
MNQKVLIIGCGLTGTLMASFLVKMNFDIEIYEKRSDPRTIEEKKNSYRTIGMSISYRGLHALERACLKHLIKDATPTYGRVTHSHDGSSIIQNYSSDKYSILTIDRKELNENLISHLAQCQNVQLVFNAHLKAIDFTERECTLDINGTIQRKMYDYIIGADGVFSACRQEYEKLLNIPTQLQQLPIGYKEFRLPFTCVNSEFDTNFIHVWSSLDKSAIFVALPSHKKQSFLINIFCPTDWVDFFQQKSITKSQIVDYLSNHFPSLNSILQVLDEEYFLGETSNMYQIKSDYWNYQDSFLLIGDAVHAISPFYAMGMNICFESCRIFNDLIKKNNGNISKAIKTFQQVRKQDTDSMQDLAYENFFNISESNSNHYNNVWNIERTLYNISNGKWKPEYHLIAFTNEPLSVVKSKILKQRQLMDYLL